jgi:hypothetical protein
LNIIIIIIIININTSSKSLFAIFRILRIRGVLRGSMADRGQMRSAPDLKKLHPDDAEIIIVNSIRMLSNPPVRNRNSLLSKNVSIS